MAKLWPKTVCQGCQIVLNIKKKWFVGGYFVHNKETVAWVPSTLSWVNLKQGFELCKMFAPQLCFYANFGHCGHFFLHQMAWYLNRNWSGMQAKKKHLYLGHKSWQLTVSQHIWYVPHSNTQNLVTVCLSVPNLVPNDRTDTCLTVLFYQFFYEGLAKIYNWQKCKQGWKLEYGYLFQVLWVAIILSSDWWKLSYRLVWEQYTENLEVI